MAKLNELHDLFVKELRDVYDAEKQIIKALPKMRKAASNEDLRASFERHLEETRGQVSRLEQVFEQLDMRARGHHCAGMAGIIEEGSELMGEDAEAAVLDAGLIASAQKVEHYEICAYGTLVAYARELRLNAAAKLLEQTLNEEKNTDKLLTGLAERLINPTAEHAEEMAAASTGRRRSR